MTNEIVVTSMHIFVQRVHIPANCMALNASDGSGPWHSLHNTIKVSNTLDMHIKFVYRIYGKENSVQKIISRNLPLLHAKQ